MQLSATPSLTANSMILEFSTGSAPGSPMHIGHTVELGCEPYTYGHVQNAFVCVESWTWVSIPIMDSYFWRS